MFILRSLLGMIFLGWPLGVMAERQSASLEIKATVPSYCKFKVDNSPSKGLNLDKVGSYRVHIANIELDCNIVSGYRILANSNNAFKLISETNDVTVPYKIMIDTLGEAKIVNDTTQMFEPEISTNAKKYMVYLQYEVNDIIAGEYNDNIEFSLDVG